MAATYPATETDPAYVAGGASDVELAAAVAVLTTAINVTAAPYNADPGAADNTAAIQAALNAGAAAERPVLIPDFFNMTGGLVWPDDPVDIIGIGKELCGLRWTSSVGADAYAISWSGVLDPHRRLIAHMTWEGPEDGYDNLGNWQVGVHVNDMHGIRLPAKATIEDCIVQNFDKGVVIERDHQRILNSQVINNYFNLYFQTAQDGQTDGWANQYFEISEFDGALKASIGIAHGATCTFSTFRSCHFGYGPWVVWMEAGAPNTGDAAALHGVHWDGCSFENVGNGWCWDESSNKTIYQQNFTSCFLTRTNLPAYVLPTDSQDWMFNVQQMLDCRVSGGEAWQAMAVGIFNILGGAGLYGAREIHLTDMTKTGQALIAGGKKLMRVGATLRIEGCTWEGDEIKGPISVLSTDCARYDLLAGAAAAVVFNTFDVYRRPAGVAYMNGEVTDCIPVATEGVYPIKTNDTISGLTVLQADERPGVLGRVRACDASLDAAIIGVAYAASASSLVRTRINIAEQVPLDSDLAAIAALSTTAYGRALLALADAAAGRTAFGLGNAATKDTGTGSTQVAVGDDSRFPTTGQKNALTGTAGTPGIGNEYATKQTTDALQPLDSDLTALAALSTTAYGRALLELADAAAGRTAFGLGTASIHAHGDYDAAGAAAEAQSASQPLDSDLTAIAALTTTSFGRAFLALADATAARAAIGTVIGTDVQAYDADLSALAALTSAANKLPYATGPGVWALADFTVAGRALLDDADASAQLTTLGISAFIKTLLDDADAATARSTLSVSSAAEVTAAITASLARRWQPSDNGYLGAAFDPVQIAGTLAPASGYVYVIRVPVVAGATLANVVLVIGTIGVTLTAGQNFAGVYLPDGTLIAKTADQAASWVSTGVKSPALIAEAGQSLILPGSVNWVHVAILAVGSTTPAFSRGQNWNIAILNEGLTDATARFAAAAGGGATSLPATRSVVRGNGQAIWAALK